MQGFHDRSKFNLLREAVWTDLERAQTLVRDDPSLLFAQNGTGETVLHFIAIENGLNEVSWLLAHGADPNTPDDFDETPLMSASSLGHYELCQLLIAGGADIAAKDHNEDSAITHAANNHGSYSSCKDCLNLLLSHLDGQDINSFFDNLQLDLLYSYAAPEIIELLVSHGLRNQETPDPSNA